MAQPYVGEIRMFGGNFAPAGWEFCSGQLLSISENEVLFQLIGTTYGGDGQSTFALPDLRGRLPIHVGNSFVLAETFGTEMVTLTTAQIPAHSHQVLSTNAVGNSKSGPRIASGELARVYSDETTGMQSLNPSTISFQGGSQPHENLMPSLCVSFIISLFGIFPSPT